MQPIVHILEIFGKLDLLTGKQLIATTHAIMEFEPEFLLLDLEGVTFADSGGLGAVVRAFKIAQVGGVRFAIFTSQTQVLSIFRLTSMNQIMEIYKVKEEFYEQLKVEIPEYRYLNEIPEVSIQVKLSIDD